MVRRQGLGVTAGRPGVRQPADPEPEEPDLLGGEITTSTDAAVVVTVATCDPIRSWQAECIKALAAVDGVRIAGWIRVSTDVGLVATGPRSAAAVPAVLVAADREASDGSLGLLLDLTGGALDGHLDASAATRRWRFGYGRSLDADPARTAISDYVEGVKGTRLALVEEPAGRILREGWLQTMSWWRGELHDHLLNDGRDWPAAAARDAIDAAWTPVPEPASEPAAAPPMDTGMPMVVLRAGAIGRRLVGSTQAVIRQPEWNVGVIDAPIEQVGNGLPPGGIHWFPTRPGFFAADPFGVEREGTLHVFFESYDQRRGLGSIWHVPVDADGGAGTPEPVIERDVHLSYPFVIEDRGRTFLMPEMSMAGKLELFEADDFPRGWRPVATLLDGVMVADASMVLFEDRWWLFATRADLGDNHSLWIWHAYAVEGPWIPHLDNPVKIDIRSARPAGTPFVSDGVLHRPAQDGSRTYGGRIAINRVEVLTPRRFVERTVASVEPAPGSAYPNGVHTISRVGNRTLIDGKVEHLVPSAVPRVVVGMARRLLAISSRRVGLR